MLLYCYNSGISSLCFTNHGEALYMMSSSELQRISLSATKIVSLEGTVDLEQLNEQDESGNCAENDDENSATVDVCTEESTKPLSVSVDETGKVVTNTINHSKPVSNENLTNGVDAPANNGGNETITSSIGDITVDSVRDHLNSTVTTLHSTTTEEIVGKFSFSFLFISLCFITHYKSYLYNHLHPLIIFYICFYVSPFSNCLFLSKFYVYIIVTYHTGRLTVLSTKTNNTTSSIHMKDLPDINLPNFKDLSPIG